MKKDKLLPDCRLGSSPEQRKAFDVYMKAFSSANFELFPEFYTEDVVLELPSAPPIAGKQAIIGFYRPMFAKVRESLDMKALEYSDDSLRLDAITRFTALCDVPDFTLGALKAGDYVEGRILVTYTLRDGRISHIAVERGGEMVRHDSCR